MLHCGVCDNNNGNCTVHNTTKLLAIEHQRLPFRSKPYEVDDTNPFYRYDPDQCILCGRCVEACQNVEVNETLSINREDPNPRVLWDGGCRRSNLLLLLTDRDWRALANQMLITTEIDEGRMSSYQGLRRSKAVKGETT
jgi:NAD-dependent dihydropyrimidine dehydrogenase PreA subunit